jgi:hypothetical protein
MLLDTGREVGTGASRVLFLIGLPLFAPLEPRGVLFVAMLLLGYFAAAAKRVICTQSRTAARDAVLFRDNSLFQLHEEQDEDRPHPYRYWKLRCLCIAQERTSSWKRKTKQEHGHSREYPEDQFTFPGHFYVASLSASDVLGVRAGTGGNVKPHRNRGQQFDGIGDR